MIIRYILIQSLGHLELGYVLAWHQLRFFKLFLHASCIVEPWDVACLHIDFGKFVKTPAPFCFFFVRSVSCLFRIVLALGVSLPVMLLDVLGLPGVADPVIADCAGGVVTVGDHVLGESTLLGLVLVLF